MSGSLDERTAGRLERVAPRARKFFRSIATDAGDEVSAAHETADAFSAPPDEADRRALARRIRASRGTREIADLGGREPDIEADAIAGHLIARAREVLRELQDGAADTSISDEDAFALEAVLQARGRPALKVEGDRIETITEAKHPGSSIWQTFLDQHEAALVKVAGATGAVIVKDRGGALKPWVQGSAWLVRPGIVVTNRHVLLPGPGGVSLVQRLQNAATKADFKASLDVAIDFAFDDRTNGLPLSCQALEVLFISETADPIDVAVIRIGPPSGGGALDAAPLDLTSKDDAFRFLYIVGHPGKMTNVPEAVLAVFGKPNERKRVSFGETMEPDPSRAGEFRHDASTIGGFSGGCVLPFLSHQVVGLHYHGDPLTGNRAFTAAALRKHAVAPLIRSGSTT